MAWADVPGGNPATMAGCLELLRKRLRSPPVVRRVTDKDGIAFRLQLLIYHSARAPVCRYFPSIWTGNIPAKLPPYVFNCIFAGS